MDNDVQKLTKRVTDLENQSLGPDPNVHPLTIQNLKHIVNGSQVFIASVASVSGSGSGISVSPSTGNVVVSNTGVTALTAGTNVTLSGSTGNVTISAAGGTAVTFLTAGTAIGLSASTGNVTVTNTGVTQLKAGTGITLSPSTGTSVVMVSASAVGNQGYFAVGDGSTDYNTSSATFVDVDATNLSITLSGFASNTILNFIVGLDNQHQGAGPCQIRLQDITNSVTVATIVSTTESSVTAFPYFTEGFYECASFPATLRLQYTAGDPAGVNKIINAGSGSLSSLYSGFTTSSGVSNNLILPFIFIQTIS